MAVSDRIMFEIYRDAAYGGQYRVVYYTELDEHNKHVEINRAMAGEHFFDGFLVDHRKEEGKAKVGDILRRLNAGEIVSPDDVQRELVAIEAAAT